MFRALLWKEWRELWILPAVAVPLAVLSLFITRMATLREMSVLPESSLTMPSPLSPAVWDTSFAVWLLLAALYIPTHLYAREKDLKTSEFLRAMPLDRFRLWWFRLFIGFTAMAGVGLTLCATIIVFRLFHRTNPDFGSYGRYMVVVSMCVAAILFSLSSSFSSIFRRQLSAIAGIAITFTFFGAIYWILHEVDAIKPFVDFYPQPFTILTLWGRYSIPEGIDYLPISMLILCPSFLFISLAAFARGSMAHQSRSRIALTYAFLAIIALSPVSLGFVRLSAGVRTSDREWSDKIRYWTVSPDGRYILLQPMRTARSSSKKAKLTRRNGPLISIDPTERRLGVVDKNLIMSNPEMFAYFPGTYMKEERIIMYSQYRDEMANIFPQTIDILNADGSRKRNIFTGRWFDSTESKNEFAGHVDLSKNENFIAFAKKPSSQWMEDGYIAIMDASGKLLGKHIISLSDEEQIYLTGWDYDSRIYFVTYNKKSLSDCVFARMNVEHMVPEEIPNTPVADGFPYPYMSPNGRWILFRELSQTDGEKQWWLYDIEKKTYRLLEKNVQTFMWSLDSRTLAYSTRIFPQPEWGTDEPRMKKLALYDLKTGESKTILDGAFYSLAPRRWSPSGKYLLFAYQLHKQRDGETDTSASGRAAGMELKLLAIDTGQIATVAQPIPYGRSDFQWIADNRLVWRNRYTPPLTNDLVPENVLIVTEKDGSNPQEIFRVEDGKYYLYGEEAG